LRETGAARSAARVRAKAERWLQRPLAVRDGVLAGKPFLLGERFTVADLSVASVLSPWRSALLVLAPYPSLSDWLARCYERPAALAARRQA
jgi:glutathione S-transferase